MPGKLIKDPVYGYIEIEDKYILKLLDSAVFQRLRNIQQTSYAALYPASVHNRFVHSIGVYYLGNKLINALSTNSNKPESDIIQKEKETFLLACFLHDVGHAPFSHSGEEFFLQSKDDNKQPIIYQQLADIVGDNDFTIDAQAIHETKKGAAKPHEIMSVIIGLNVLSNYLDIKIDKPFFARCITGYLYSQNNEENSIKNCLIGLLNSSVIDVDKLDYTIRDTYMTGYYNTSIDIDRLFTGVRLAKNGDREIAPLYEFTYHKNALSVIENVIYANDCERKWIQTHPVVLYEVSLVQSLIRKVDKFLTQTGSQSLFSYDSLTETGQKFSDAYTIHLLSDEDIIFTAKNLCPDPLTNEFFARDKRRNPIWKSEAEYNTLFTRQLGPEKLDTLEKQVANLEKKLIEKIGFPLINEEVLQKYQEELEAIKANPIIVNKDKDDLLEGRNEIIKWLNGLKKIAAKYNLEYDFAVISSQKFSSNFNKTDINNIRVWFPSIGKYNYIKEVQPILESTTYREKMFFIYYNKKQFIENAKTRKDKGKPDDLNIEGFVADFIKEFVFS